MGEGREKRVGSANTAEQPVQLSREDSVAVQCGEPSAPTYAICIWHMTRQAFLFDSAALRRAGSRQWVLKPQDLVVALKLFALGRERLSYAALGQALHLSQFEAHAAVQRLIAARLASSVDGRVRPVVPTLRSFLVRGAPYAYPPVRGEVTVGVPTAHGAAPLMELTVGAGEVPPVWPDPEGKVRGQSLLPLYPTAPRAALEDRRLYELLALFDALRIGQAREREMAAKLIEETLK